MKIQPEFLLEKLVHYVVRDESAEARGVMLGALTQGNDAGALLAEIVLPAVECVHQLKRDGLIGGRVFNGAVRGLSGVLHMLKGSMGEAAASRGRALILSAPLEETDLGAQVVAALAEGHGFEVLFAGAHLEMEELLFACTRLEPEFVVIHGSLAASRAGGRRVIERVRAAEVGAQVAVVGAVAGGEETLGADVVGEEAMGVLEMMALCPEYRAGGTGGGEAIEMLAGASGRVDAEVVRAFLGRMFPRRAFSN